ncbi:MAG TPA: class I SAM-dependent methyltransferase [Fibrobacteria bacterium]|nr:class I SAM-dependent methyltransferase [Fibrobacteria bacterium]
MVPPRRMIFIGGQDFKEVGEEFLRIFQEPGGLRPHHAVLDVGSGIGRMARPLTRFLDPSKGARYEGFDITRSGVEWCRKNISVKFPHFRFQPVDLYNKIYNPKGATQARDFRFPFADGTFDFLFLTSVFTHMFPDDVNRYISEIARVLKPGGRCLATFFIWNPESAGLVEAGKSSLLFPFEGKGYRHAVKYVPEEAIALPEKWVLDTFSRYGLDVQAPIHFGKWCGRASYLSFQDIVVSQKRA